VPRRLPIEPRPGAAPRHRQGRVGVKKNRDPGVENPRIAPKKRIR